MKKILLMVVAATMAMVCASAQSDFKRHEVSLGWGTLANSEWIGVLDDIAASIAGATTKNDSPTGTISAEYYYHPAAWIGVGTILGWSHTSKDIWESDAKIGKGNYSYYTVMPAVKFDWLRKNHFGMYSKLAAGATMRHAKEDFTGGASYDNFDGNMFFFNFQASLIGIEAGGHNVRAFTELGVGEQGFLLAGVRFRF